MQWNLNAINNNKTYLVLSAGYATAPLFLESLRAALHSRLEQAGYEVHSELSFPYGDWSRGRLAQLKEIRHDLRLGLRRTTLSIGGSRLISTLAHPLTSEGVNRFILIGHSGGGVAAVHAASLLQQEQANPPHCSVVMIGSPRIPIPNKLKSSVLSLFAEGSARDYIAKLGTFGGWAAWPRFRMLPAWKANKHAPEWIQGIPLVGGHPDYFRDSSPFVNERGITNLELVLEAILLWLSDHAAR